MVEAPVIPSRVNLMLTCIVVTNSQARRSSPTSAFAGLGSKMVTIKLHIHNRTAACASRVLSVLTYGRWHLRNERGTVSVGRVNVFKATLTRTPFPHVTRRGLNPVREDES